MKISSTCAFAILAATVVVVALPHGAGLKNSVANLQDRSTVRFGGYDNTKQENDLEKRRTVRFGGYDNTKQENDLEKRRTVQFGGYETKQENDLEKRRTVRFADYPVVDADISEEADISIEATL